MKRPEIFSIGDHSWRIQEETVRCFLFVGSKRALLVDSGMELPEIDGLLKELTNLPITVVNTHTDFDHTSGNVCFPEIYMHPSEYSFYTMQYEIASRLRPLWEGDVIDIGQRKFEVILQPGHTPGSIALLDRENRVLIGGDGIQDGTIYLFGGGRSLIAYQHSLERLLTHFGDAFDTVYPSHGSFPISKDVIPHLIQGAKDVLAGRVMGIPSVYSGASVFRYPVGVASLLLDIDMQEASRA